MPAAGPASVGAEAFHHDHLPALPLKGRECAEPGGEGFGAVEGEDVAGARLGVQRVGEVGFGAGAFVDERQRAAPRRQAGGLALCVLAGLHLHAGERGALLLGLDHAGGLAVDVEQVVRFAVAGVQLELADRHAAGGVDVGGLEVLHRPAGGGEQAVDVLAGELLGRCHVQSNPAGLPPTSSGESIRDRLDQSPAVDHGDDQHPVRFDLVDHPIAVDKALA